MLLQTIILALASVASATQPGLLFSRASFPGVATFNDYAAQSSTVCGPKAGKPGTFGAAAGDISPNIAGGKCYANIDTKKCNGQGVVNGYQGPACPKKNCGLCYQVTNNGGFGGASIGGKGKKVIVQIIDMSSLFSSLKRFGLANSEAHSCPSVSAYNFCKTSVPAAERCGSSNTNSLDIDNAAYKALTGQNHGPNSPNLNIQISPVACP